MRSYHVEFDIEVDETSGVTAGEWDDTFRGKRIDKDAAAEYIYVPGDAQITETTSPEVPDGYYASGGSGSAFKRKLGFWYRLYGSSWIDPGHVPAEHDSAVRDGRYKYLGPLT